MSLISIRNLSVRYGDFVVLERVNLEVAQQEFCSIVGASGCGKSTFLRLLLSSRPAARSASTAPPSPRSRRPTAAWCSSATPSFPT